MLHGARQSPPFAGVSPLIGSCHGHCRCSRPRPRHRPGEEVRRIRSSLHLVPHRRPLPRRRHRRAVRRRAPRAQPGAADGAAFAVRAHPVLQHDLLLLRVQQGDHQGPRAQRQVHQVRGSRDRDRERPRRGRPEGRAAALGRRHADVPRAGRDVDADGDAARPLRVRARRRDLDRGRSAQGRPPTRSRSWDDWASTGSRWASRTSIRRSSRRSTGSRPKRRR